MPRTAHTPSRSTSIYVLDKDEALDFYVNQLGLGKGNDVRQGSYRWQGGVPQEATA